MSRLEELKEEFAHSQLFDTWKRLKYFYKDDQDAFEKVLDLINSKYGKECSQASLEKASETAKTHKVNRWGRLYDIEVNKESITNLENIVLL